MTEIEIRDPDDADEHEDASSVSSSDAGLEEAESPYRNLLVPLIVVPALIIMVVFGVGALFLGVLGDPPTPEENIATLLHGGRNERDQAAFGLMRQVLEEVGANAESGVEHWVIEPALEAEIRQAWEDVTRDALESPKEVRSALALTILMARLGDTAGLAELAQLTALPTPVDPDGEGRFYAAAALGCLNAEENLSAAQAAVARGALLRLLDAGDAGLRLVAAIGLQTLPGEDTSAALRGLLADRSVELRLQAALSLAELGDPAGEPVLLEMLERAPYEAERERDRSKWFKEASISAGRLKALRGLAAVGRTPPEELLRRLADEDPDISLRECALELLQSKAKG